MVQLYIGDGKGKTTAAIGLAVRAAGWGEKVYVAQFLKNPKDVSGECSAVKKYRLPVTIERFSGQTHPMFLPKEKFDRDRMLRSVDTALKTIHKHIKSKRFSIIILDEILNAYKGRFVSKEQLQRLLKTAKKCELVLTGRGAPSWLINQADYVSYIKKVKHPYDKGISARRAIEF